MSVIEGGVVAEGLDAYRNSGVPTNGVDEVHTLTVSGSPTGGTYTLKFRGEVTAAIAYNAAASAVQTALRALNSIGATGLSVSGSGGGPYTITFADHLGKRALGELFEIDTNSLTGGTSPTVADVEATAGVTATARGAGTGATLIDTATGIVYKNVGTEADPNWAVLPGVHVQGVHVNHDDASGAKTIVLPARSLLMGALAIATETDSGGDHDFGIIGGDTDGIFDDLAGNAGTAGLTLGDDPDATGVGVLLFDSQDTAANKVPKRTYYATATTFGNTQNTAGTAGEWDVYLIYAVLPALS